MKQSLRKKLGFNWSNNAMINKYNKEKIIVYVMRIRYTRRLRRRTHRKRLGTRKTRAYRKRVQKGG